MKIKGGRGWDIRFNTAEDGTVFLEQKHLVVGTNGYREEVNKIIVWPHQVHPLFDALKIYSIHGKKK